MGVPTLHVRLLRPALYAAAVLVGVAAQAQSGTRSIDGHGNNLDYPDWGAADGWLVNTCPTGFSDGASSPAGATRANPRAISNAIFAQDAERFSASGLSDMWWAFGQFVDHDITLTVDGRQEFMGIRVPRGDRFFDPDSTGRGMIPMMRSAGELGERGVRRYRNEISSFLDASNVYGSTAQRAAWLRTGEGGKLRVSSGNLLPFNTSDGQFETRIDTTAPGMDGGRDGRHLFVAGDVRANENSLLTSVHTVWVREHNRLCDSLESTFFGASDEQIYQHARRLVGAQLQHIVYDEWLPALGVDLPAAAAYDATVDPRVSNEFAAAGFRFGHSVVGTELWLLDANDQPLPNSPLSLREVFFDPVGVIQRQGIGPILRGASRHRQQELDCAVVDDLRSFLFGAPGAGGLDLAAININRGRDRGVANFNAIREELGLRPYTSFAQLTGEAELAARLATVYGEVSDLDAWVGMLAERKTNGVGATLRAVLSEQFLRLRSGDRFFYTHDPAFSHDERAWIERQSLAGVIGRNSAISAPEKSFFVPNTYTSLALAKTAGRGPITAVLQDRGIRVAGLAAGRSAVITLVDALGRTRSRAEVIADARGETTYQLPGSITTGVLYTTVSQPTRQPASLAVYVR